MALNWITSYKDNNSETRTLDFVPGYFIREFWKKGELICVDIIKTSGHPLILDKHWLPIYSKGDCPLKYKKLLEQIEKGPQ